MSLLITELHIILSIVNSIKRSQSILSVEFSKITWKDLQIKGSKALQELINQFVL